MLCCNGNVKKLSFCVSPKGAMPETHIELKDLTFPQAVYESLGRTFYSSILEFYEDKENKKAFEEWMKNKEN